MLAASHIATSAVAGAGASPNTTNNSGSGNGSSSSSNGKSNGLHDKQLQQHHHHRQTSKRVEISSFVSKFQKTLGDGWDSYQIAVSLFIVGKLSRAELLEQIAPVLSKKETRHMHNRLLMSMLANCYRIEPLDGISTSLFGNTSKKRKLGSKSSQYEQLKKDVLSLSIRERVRIKGITKESGKKGMIQNVMVLSRQAMVPKVPIVTSNNGPSSPNSASTSGSGAAATAAAASGDANAGKNKGNNNLEMTLISVKDILDMINEPLCTETYELPERRRMRDIMLGLAREHGLLGGVSMKAVDVLYLGLQYHLKSIIGNVIDNLKARRETDKKSVESSREWESGVHENSEPSDKKMVINNNSVETGTKRKKLTITTEDLFDSFSLTPHMIKPYGTIDYLNDVMLKNDDDYDFISRQTLEANVDWTNGEKVLAWDDSNEKNIYVIPNKVTDVSSLLKSHEAIWHETTSHPDDPVPKIDLALKDKDIGTPDELNWVINGLLSEDM